MLTVSKLLIQTEKVEKLLYQNDGYLNNEIIGIFLFYNFLYCSNFPLCVILIMKKKAINQEKLSDKSALLKQKINGFQRK